MAENKNRAEKHEVDTDFLIFKELVYLVRMIEYDLDEDWFPRRIK